ncbi:prepilin peptidase [Acidiphilium sp. AL]|uniref:Prepilin peptidase n=1 Tax=Acidiphilium iwatense TaxID=768198 RepID=A0ABS9DSE8_9PROT|nr:MULTISPECIES: prepilin peptidase [Acidiphilium]MCF3945645.1 prepilin peptidase [Acidiphilium iwatense]MCU4159550.1 prepilin peptidase [Acidiphilium sp. AL]
MTTHIVMLVWSGAITLCLFGAALSDIATRSIPDHLSLIVAALAVPVRLIDRNLLAGLIVAAVVFVALTLAWTLRALGGGDVKLWSACSLLVPPAWVAQVAFSLRVLLIGGFVAMAYLALRRFARSSRPVAPGDRLFRRLSLIESWRARRGGSIPYGVAISLAALLTLWPRAHG